MPKIKSKTPAKEETLGQRIARLRKACGLTQTELAEQLETIQAIVSDYERDNRRIHAEMLARIAQALRVSADEVLGLTSPREAAHSQFSLKLIRRLQKIDALPTAQQKVLLQTVDAFLRGVGQ